MSLVKIDEDTGMCIIGKSNTAYLSDVAESRAVSHNIMVWDVFVIATCNPETHTVMYEAGEEFGKNRTEDIREANIYKSRKDANAYILQTSCAKSIELQIAGTRILNKYLAMSPAMFRYAPSKEFYEKWLLDTGKEMSNFLFDEVK